MRAKSTKKNSGAASRTNRAPSPKSNWIKPLKPSSPPREATGAGGTARKTVPRTTPNSTRCIANISRRSISLSASKPPESLAQPIKSGAEAARLILPSAYLDINVDGRETSFFEWLGAGIYTSDQRQGAMHGRVYFMETLFYGFAEDRFFVRVDLFPEGKTVLRDCEFRVTIHAAEEIRVSIRVLESRVIGFVVEHDDVSRLNPHDKVTVGLDRILEVSIKRDVVPVKGRSFRFGVALWQGGLPIDLLPGEGTFEIQLGEEQFAWPVS